MKFGEVLKVASLVVVFGLSACDRKDDFEQKSNANANADAGRVMSIRSEGGSAKNNRISGEYREAISSIPDLMERIGRVKLRDQDGRAIDDDGAEARFLGVLAKIHPRDCLNVLKEAGLIPGTLQYQQALEYIGVVWAEKNPKVLADWLLADSPLSFGSNVVSLAKHDPELAIDVMMRAKRDNNEIKSAEYGVVFSQISSSDPARAIHLFEETKFEDERYKFDAIMGVIGGINRETITPDRMATLLSELSEENLNAFPSVAVRAGGILVDAFPVDQVLAQFPLDGAPWQRQVVISYLEAAAYRGHFGDMEVEEFLKSGQSQSLTGTERDKLLKILGK